MDSLLMPKTDSKSISATLQAHSTRFKKMTKWNSILFKVTGHQNVSTLEELMMETDKKFDQAIKQLSSSSEHWLAIKKVLEEEISANQELITLIDKRVKENEDKMSKLN